MVIPRHSPEGNGVRVAQESNPGSRACVGSYETRKTDSAVPGGTQRPLYILVGLDTGESAQYTMLSTLATFGFVSGHDFSRAVKAQTELGFSPCAFFRPILTRAGFAIAGAKALSIFGLVVARLKSCPDTKQKTQNRLGNRPNRKYEGVGAPKIPAKGRLLMASLLLGASMIPGAWGQKSAASPAPDASTGAVQPAPPIPQGAVVLDRVVAVINGSVILQSDVTEEMGYAILQPFTVDSARNTPERALQRLIDRDLILQQMQTAQTVTPPTPEEVQQRITQLRGLIPDCVQYHCQTDAGWLAFLQAKGLTEKEVEAHWAQRMLILSFIQSRFGSGVRITQAEIADYYHKTLVPQLQGKAVKPPALEAVSTRIEEILLQQRVSSLLLEWLQSLKSEGSVSILDPAYGKVGTTGLGDESESGGQP
jgi:peptidyl-prolyl cis-trans isomerase SurA